MTAAAMVARVAATVATVAVVKVVVVVAEFAALVVVPRPRLRLLRLPPVKHLLLKPHLHRKLLRLLKLRLKAPKAETRPARPCCEIELSPRDRLIHSERVIYSAVADDEAAAAAKIAYKVFIWIARLPAGLIG